MATSEKRVNACIDTKSLQCPYFFQAMQARHIQSDAKGLGGGIAQFGGVTLLFCY